MKIKEFIITEKRRRRRPRWAAYGPGPYGGYGYDAGYSGDGGIGEASYEGNIGMMEVAKFFRVANETQKKLLKELMSKGKRKLAWKLIQDVTKTKLQGQQFTEDRTADVVFDTGEKKKVRYVPGRKDIIDMIVRYYLKQGLRVVKVNDEEIQWSQVSENLAERTEPFQDLALEMEFDEDEKAVNPGRRRILAGLAGFAAVSAMPPGLVSALSTPEGIQSMSVGDVSALLKAIRAYLPPYDQEDWTGTFDRWDKMAQALRIPDSDLDAADKLDRLMRQYRRDPEAASAKLLRHLQRHAVDLTDVRKQTISQWDDVETVSKSDPVNDEIRQMQQQIADYNARQRREKTPGLGQAQTAATAVTAFRDLVQRVIDAGTSAASAPPREKYMGRIEPTSSAPALPAPDRSAAEIMAQLRDVVGRDLTAQEREVVRQEVSEKS